MIAISIDSKESDNTKHLFEMLLNADVVNLPEGDIKVYEYDNPDNFSLFERKTWSDAYSSWTSKRMQEQISRLVASGGRNYLIIEGSPRDIFTANPNQIQSLQQFFNRLTSEAIPVIYTESLDETIRFIRSHALRMEENELYQLIRPVTVVTSTSNKHHAVLEQIPRVGKKLAKKIYQTYGSLGDFVVNFKTTSEEVGVKPKSVTYQKIVEFLDQTWNPQVDREIIFQAVGTDPDLTGLEDIASEPEEPSEQKTLF